MKKEKTLRKVLSLVLTLVMVFGSFGGTGIFATDEPVKTNGAVTWEKVDNSVIKEPLSAKKLAPEFDGNVKMYKDTDVVRVSIFLDEESTIEAGFSTDKIAENRRAKAYRESLAAKQESIAAKISRKVLGGEKLDVVWNLTLVANVISANVEYGKISAIESVAGVKKVVVEKQYQAQSAETVDKPNMSTSREMIGSTYAWAQGYTGAGSKVAIIDTGIDDDHQSFNAKAYEYALAQNAEAKGMTYEEYVASLNLITNEKVAALWSQLNASKLGSKVTVSGSYLTSKVPFAVNYIDKNLVINHDRDSQGEHGSHVTGISAANRYIQAADGTFTDSLDSVFVQGVAPDAQIVTMKVFGAGGGAYDSDYMIAIEDAIILGCDSVNLSLGSSTAGISDAGEYKDVMDTIVKSGTVVVMSAGNSYQWPYFSYTGGYPYYDDVNFDTVGSPGSFTESLAVASVNNDGVTGAPIQIGGKDFFYTETSGPNALFTTIGGEHEYVFFDSIAADENGASVLDEYADAIKGKVVFVYRGSSSFYQKMDVVAKLGGIGCIVVNNQPGTINMSLDDAKSHIPCVSITQADGEIIKGLSEQVEEGYWKGTVNVASAISSATFGSEYYTMSDFSSWGVPGTLEMKPEITAPGGDIYSVNGAIAGGKAYELMSGTSMAAPQVTGMVAVLGQYLRENGFEESTGYTARQLANSLLMSTAIALREEESGGEYYSILKQGAGLGNVNNAVNAKTFIMMHDDATESAFDGKVKVELGDDPERKGVYTFGFSVNNMEDTEKYFNLYADFFTQDLFMDDNGIYIDTWTTPLATSILWKVDGTTVVPTDDASILNWDFDGDGDVDTDDGQALLDYATTVRTELNDIEYADFDGDEDIDTYDAYLFFKGLSTAAIKLPAGGSIDVECTVTLEDIDDFDIKGAYVEGFVYAEQLVNEEGALGDLHSIPVLGYYGSWTDPSMFDRGSYNEYLAGTEPFVPYLAAALPEAQMANSLYFNALQVAYPGDSTSYLFGGNPMVEDEVYHPERDAINKSTKVSKFTFSPIRNASASKFEVTGEDGTVYATSTLGVIAAPYYNQTNRAWSGYNYSFSPNFTPKDVEDGEIITLGLTAAPEYYTKSGAVDWSQLGAGATKSFTLRIDDTEPVITNMGVTTDLVTGDNKLQVGAVDNQYIAAVALYDDQGNLLDYYGSDEDAEEGAAYTCNFDLTAGDHYLIQVSDYALNAATYKLNLNAAELENDYVLTVSPASVRILKGTTATVSASAQPWGADDKVVWSSADEAIATVDAFGVITGKKAGTTTVTATSVSHPEVSATVAVEVYTINLTIKGVLQDEDANPLFFSYDLANDDTWQKTADISLEKTDISAFTWDKANTTRGYMLDSNGFLHTFNMNDFTEISVSEETLLSTVGILPDDIAMVDFYNSANKGTRAYGIYGSYLLVLDPLAENGYVGAYNFSNLTVSADFTAVTNAGIYAGKYETTMALDNEGYLYTFYTTKTGDLYTGGMTLVSGLESLEWPYMSGEAQGASLVKGDDGNLYLSYFNGESIDIYQIKKSGSRYSATKIANLGDGVWPCSLYEVTANAHAPKAFEAPAEVEEIKLEKVELEKVFAIAESKADGSLNAFSGNSAAAPQVTKAPFDGILAAGTETTAVVKLTAVDADGKDVDSTNGLLTETWDPTALELVDVKVNAENESVKIEDGKVTIGYVDLEGIEAGETVAELTFKVLGRPAVVTNTETEANGDEVEVEEVICILNHAYTEVKDAKEPTCTEDGYTGDTYCVDCGELLEEGKVIPATGHGEAVVVGAKEATCTKDGYTGDKVCPDCEEVLEEGEVIPATGHDFDTEKPEYVWNEDKTECTVVFTCKNCDETDEHDCEVEEEVVKEATETEPGLKKITATYTDEQGNVYTTTVEVVIPVKTSPETGLVISGIGVIGALGAAAYVFGRKRKEDEE